MNSVAELYTLKLEVNGTSVALGPEDLDISIIDSIHSVYPRASITIEDTSGKLLDSRFATLGINYTFTIGFNNTQMTLPFVVDNYQTVEQKYTQRLNGTMQIDLIHAIMINYISSFKAYSSVPSSIVNSLISQQGFSKTYIETTTKIQDQPYYNPNYSFEDFINKILLPNSKSVVNSSEPFYCFIDVQNQFHYETISKMLNRKAYKTLYYKSGINDISSLEKVLELKPFSSKLSEVYPYLTMTQYTIDEDGNLDLEKANYSIKDNRKTPLPVIDKINLSNFQFSNEIKSLDDNKKDLIKLIQKKKGHSQFDRLIVKTFLDITSSAGKVVNLEVDYDLENRSAAYSGTYIIEMSKHTWNSKIQKGYTTMILSRQKATFPMESKITRSLIQ